MNVIRCAGAVLSVALLCSCGGTGGSEESDATPVATEITVSGSPATDGVFDPAPMSDGSALWMSYSAVLSSPNDSTLSQVRTRIASSTDAGATWTDATVDPNDIADPDFQVDDGYGGKIWATWRFEVSRLLYDPFDTDANRRWKILWHRYVAAGANFRLFQDGWIGLSTATAPDGSWSAERKLFTGTAYNSADMNAVIGPPEFPLAPLDARLSACIAYTEPGMLARTDGIYVSLQCAAGSPAAGKVVLLRCDREFAACTYLGDMLTNDEAAQFSLAGQSLDGFGATELVESAGGVYLLVTGHESSPDAYRGCLAFRVSDLGAAKVARDSGNSPVLVKRVAGTAGSFNGACGYDPHASGSGIIYSEYVDAAPHFRLFASHQSLP
jgi:hypothetical protein